MPKEKPFYTEPAKARINQMYAFVTIDETGDEGIPAFFNPDAFPPGYMPMVGADMDRISSLEEIARQLKAKTGMKIKLVYFSHRTDVREI